MCFFFFLFFSFIFLRWILDLNFIMHVSRHTIHLHLLCFHGKKLLIFFNLCFDVYFWRQISKIDYHDTINRTNETKLAIPHWYNRQTTSNPLGGYNCVSEGRFEVIWQKFMPCTGPQTQGDFKFCRDFWCWIWV